MVSASNEQQYHNKKTSYTNPQMAPRRSSQIEKLTMSIRTLEKNVTNVWGDKGRKWLQNLADTIAKLSAHWQLSDITPVENMSYNYVALAKQHHNTPVVIKFSCDKTLIEDEYRALKHFNGTGSICVIDKAAHHNALLLEQAIPGYSLKANYAEDINNTIEIYASIVATLASQPKPDTQYTHVEKWCQAIDKITDPRIKPIYIDKAKELKHYLLSSNDNEYLCHGDLHLENILCHNKKWLSIDPKGIIGETAFEAAAFDLLDKSDWDEPKTIPDKINQRLSLLANHLGIHKDRLQAWVFLRVIIAAQWFIEDNSNPDEILRLAPILYPMLSKRYHKNNVCLTYETISDWYDQHRCKDLFEKDYLEKIIKQLPPKASILDLGCGTGQPIAEYFIQKGFDVTGVDGSQAQINKALQLVPEMHIICDDMRYIHLEKQFDCIIAWHSFFHLTQDDQRAMFAVFKQHIKPGGLLVFTSGTSASEVWSDNGGEMLYHASLSKEEYQSLLTKHHFEIVLHKVEDPDCGNATVWVAKHVAPTPNGNTRYIMTH